MMKRLLFLALACACVARAANVNVQVNDSTGVVWRPTAFNTFLVPSQTGHSGKFLTTDGTTSSWATVSGGGGGSYTFTAADFNESGSTVSIDYANGQKATSLIPGFLTAADWIAFNAKAPTASPTFTGTPAAPTAAADTNTTQIATTAFVIGQSYLKTTTAATTYASLASPTFTGTIGAGTGGVQALDGVAWAESAFNNGRGSYMVQSSTLNPGVHAITTSGAPSQPIFSGSAARGTLSSLSPTLINDGTLILFRSYGGSTWANAARIAMFASDTHSETSRPSYVSFETAASGSTTVTERGRFSSTGLSITGNLTLTGAYTDLIAVNGSGVNVGGKVDWSQLMNVPAGFADGSDDGSGGGSGTVTNTGGNLTANAVVLGAGGVDSKVVAGVTTDGTSRLQLGVAGGAVGAVELRNATSGTVSIVPPTGALGTAVLTTPIGTDTLAGIAATQTLTNKSIDAGQLTGTIAAARMPALTGDVTSSAGAVATTLATVNSNVGTFGSATAAPAVTVNGKGLVTAASNVTITPAVGSITGLGTGVATFLATPSHTNFAAAVTGETGTGAPVFNVDPIILAPNAAMAAWEVDVTKLTNTKTLTGTTATLTLSATPTAGGVFGMRILGHTSDCTVTLWSGTVFDEGQNEVITTFVVPANSKQRILVEYDGTTYFASGVPGRLTITNPAAATAVTFASGGSFITAGAYSLTLTATGATNVTLPTTGTLATLAGSETFTNKTLTAPVFSGVFTHDGAASITRTATTGNAIDPAKWNKQALTGPVTATIATVAAERWFDIIYSADGSGPYTVTLPANIKKVDGTTLSSVSVPASGYVHLTFRSLGSDNYIAYGEPSSSGAGDLLAANNLSDLANAATARTNLGLTANGSSLVTAANYAAMRTLLDLEAGTDFLAYPTGTPTGSKFLRDDNTWATPAGAGTVTHTGGALTSNAVVLGAGSDDTKVVAGITTDGTAQLNLGVNTTTAGGVKLFGGTSGDVTISPTAAAGTATVITLPATTGTVALVAGNIGAATATTPSANDNDTSVATTAFVQTELADYATLTGAESLTNKKLGSLTSNGFVKTSGGDGTLSVDTATYLVSADIDTSAELAAILGDENGSSGGFTRGTGATHTTATLAGISTINGASILTAAAQGSATIDVTLPIATRALSGDETFQVSATPADETWFSVVYVGDGTARTITAGTGTFWNMAAGATLTTFTVPINGVVHATFRYNSGNTTYYVYGLPTTAGSGDMVLASTQTNTGAKTFNVDTLIAAGSTSGTTKINAAAVAGTTTVTLPNANSTLPIFSQQMTYTGPTAARTVTLPDANFTAARTDAAQTFTGVQTFSSAPVIGTITNTGTLTLPTSTDTLVGRATTDTLTNKRITPRTGTVASSGTPTINTDNVDLYTITALAANITSFTTNLSGTPTEGQKLMIRILDNGSARTIAWGASFAARGVALPTTTVISKYLYVGFIWNSVTSTWDCIASAQET